MSKPLVIFDGGCNMCQRQMRFVTRCDWLNKLDQMPYDEAIEHYDDISREQLGDGLRLRHSSGTVAVGIDAVRGIMLRTPLGFLPALALFVPPIHWLGAKAYDTVAARRSTTSCTL